MKKLYRNFIFDLTIAITALVLGIIMLPPFGIGIYALNTLLAATIVVYFLVYLWDKLGRTKGAIFLLTVTECVIYFFVVVDLIIQQFNVFEVLSVCRALGLVLWVRGTISAIGMYITALSTNRKKSSLHKKLVPMQAGDVPITYADTSALERDFGFKPNTSLRTGLRKFAEWYKEFYIK